MHCPYCGDDCGGSAEYVDVGVGHVQVTAHQCDRCYAYELSPYRDDEGPFSEEETNTGWRKVPPP